MNEQTVVFLKNWFEQYAKTFYSQDEDVQLHVRLKEEHTWRVVEHATAIGKSLGLLPEDLLLAERERQILKEYKVVQVLQRLIKFLPANILLHMV